MTPHPIDIKTNGVIYSNQDMRIPTKQHYLKVKKLLDLDSYENSYIYIKGKTVKHRDNTDVEYAFRQESYFFYLTGVNEPGFHVLIDLNQDKVHLIPPHIDESDEYWTGPTNHSQEELKNRYDIDHVIKQADLTSFLHQTPIHRIYVLNQAQLKELHKIAPINSQCIDHQLLELALNESRLVKFDWEVNIIRNVMHASSFAHIHVMKNYKLGMNEARLAALFRWSCALHDIYRQAYLPIVASGPRNAILHYSHNNQPIPTTKHAMVLIDAGGEDMCYSADITRTFPVTGIFSNEAKTIYNIVLKMQQAALSLMKPGAFWRDLQQIVLQVLCEELIKIGILIGDKQELIHRLVPTAFFYHGLGHTVGLDVHDVGGKSCHNEEDECEFLYNRPLEANMVLTVEPGLYFNENMLKIWTNYQGYQHFFNLDMIEKYRHVGGVRIEDTIVITQEGYENLTLVPKQPHEIEGLMNVGQI